MIFDLVRDFGHVLAALPDGHPRRQLLSLLDEAVRRDADFIGRHPTTLFQCLWNSSWWYDCPEAARHYELPCGHPRPPWEAPLAGRLSVLLEGWRLQADQVGRPWLRALRPPLIPLGAGLRLVIHGHARPVSRLAFAPDGRLLTAALDGSVGVWDAGTGVELARTPSIEDRRTWGLAAFPDGRRAAVAGNQAVRIWDIDAGTESTRVAGAPPPFTSLAVSPDGTRLAAGAGDRTVRVWDARTGAEVARLVGHADEVDSVAYSPDGRRLATGSADRTVRLWDARTGAETVRLEGHRERVDCVRYAPDGTWLVSLGSDQVLQVWDLRTRSVRVRITGYGYWGHTVAVAPDGRHVAAGTGDGRVVVWDARTGAEVGRYEGHQDSVSCLDFSPDGRRVASTDLWTVRVWEGGGSGPPPRLPGRHGGDVIVSADGRRAVTTGSGYDRDLCVWDAAAGVPLARFAADMTGVQPEEITFSADGRRLVARPKSPYAFGRLPRDSRDRSPAPPRGWDVETGRELRPDEFGDPPPPAAEAPWVAGYDFRDRPIEEAASGRAVAWFADRVTHVVALDGGRRWAGTVGDYFCLLALENPPPV